MRLICELHCWSTIITRSVVFTNKKIDRVYTSAYFIQSYQITDNDYAFFFFFFFFFFNLEIEMSIHDRITLAERKRHVCLAFQKEKHGTCLKQKKHERNVIILTTFCIRNRTYMYIYIQEHLPTHSIRCLMYLWSRM